MEIMMSGILHLERQEEMRNKQPGGSFISWSQVGLPPDHPLGQQLTNLRESFWKDIKLLTNGKVTPDETILALQPHESSQVIDSSLNLGISMMFLSALSRSNLFSFSLRYCGPCWSSWKPTARPRSS